MTFIIFELFSIQQNLHLFESPSKVLLGKVQPGVDSRFLNLPQSYNEKWHSYFKFIFCTVLSKVKANIFYNLLFDLFLIISLELCQSAHSAGPLGVLKRLHWLPKTLAIALVSLTALPLQCTAWKQLLKHAKNKVV